MPSGEPFIYLGGSAAASLSLELTQSMDDDDDIEPAGRRRLALSKVLGVWKVK
jgi:hypothetical protein